MKVCPLGLRVSLRIAVSLFAALLISRQGFSQTTYSSNIEGASLTHAETASAAELPDAPLPQGVGQDQAQGQPKPAAGQSTDSSSSPAATSSQSADQKPDGTQPSQQDLANQQLQAQKKQRVLGFIPSFNTTYDSNVVSMTPKQKFKLAFSQATDPFQFLLAGIAGGLSEAEGSDYGYGGGPGGYFKRVGADYADSFDGAMIGNAILPSLLHQDPRYFRRGYGTAKKRIFYALSTSFIAKHDNTGKWQPNYSNLGGNLVAGAISTLYVPEDEKTAGNVFEGFALVTVEGAGGAVLQEFWPDISRRFFHKDPTHGHDAILRAKHASDQ